VKAALVQRQLRGRLSELQRHRRDLHRPGDNCRSGLHLRGVRRNAEDFFGAGDARTPAAHAVLERLTEVGLGYLSLGQPLTTLSGGERQRLKLATHMTGKGSIYVIDEATTGLHLADVEQLLGLLDRLVDSGKSLIVIEHHRAVVAHADWIIDLGPGAGHDGGRIVFEGTPADLVADRSTLTGEHLAAYIGT
jgi:excinuclease UvrABC ATPase subunit